MTWAKLGDRTFEEDRSGGSEVVQTILEAYEDGTRAQAQSVLADEGGVTAHCRRLAKLIAALGTQETLKLGNLVGTFGALVINLGYSTAHNTPSN